MSFQQSSIRSRRLLAISAGAVAVLALAGPASAKEAAGTVTFSPPPTTNTASCNPIQSLKIDSDTNHAESGLASITVDYQVKPCDSKQSVTLR